jgi:hypothetical protein
MEMTKFVSLVCVVAFAISMSVSAVYAGSLSTQQQQSLDQMAVQVLGQPPSDGVYHGASITSTTSQQPAGRHDCHVIKVVDEHGVWQRWQCPHISGGSHPVAQKGGGSGGGSCTRFTNATGSGWRCPAGVMPPH